MNPLLYDLFCCAGGAGMGYHRAGFEVVGIDKEPQPHYPFRFIQMDALEFLRRYLSGEYERAAAFHASPPCQRYSVMTNGRWQDRVENHPDLIGPTRDLLLQTGVPYVIENVEGAREELNAPFLLCGTMFGLKTKYGNQLRRHRYFETWPFFVIAPPCNHNNLSAIGVYGGGQNPARRKRRPDTASAEIDFGITERARAMGIDWMVGSELNEAIPPAYTTFIGEQLMTVIEGVRP